jgi:RNA polymerase sigma-70 factor (ECF subfamily)
MAPHDELKEKGEALHARLLARIDHRVTAEIAEMFLPLLAGALERRFFGATDPHFPETLAIDSLLGYLRHPERFDPSKGSLIGYLYMDAYWNGLDLMRRSKKSVELRTSDCEYLLASMGGGNTEAEMIEAASPMVARAFAVVNEGPDREMLSLMMDGERDADAYAEVLGIEGLPRAERSAIVKRHKDRLKAAVRRRLKQCGRR